MKYRVIRIRVFIRTEEARESRSKDIGTGDTIQYSEWKPKMSLINPSLSSSIAIQQS